MNKNIASRAPGIFRIAPIKKAPADAGAFNMTLTSEEDGIQRRDVHRLIEKAHDVALKIQQIIYAIMK
ncbi:hypothetical protein [Paenibacillus abyssi]|uniref:Uncharacterized protein n=1 Tax=Paenibacillus abyssi TaxID=1340531 RepID=A0A917G4V2_9BACL|nr:hypothetical protein [Paenibacillus abyssi]GGG23166.1 hypothetical protein GCM10010916_44670 [Paenibacillus abyssi]